MIDYKLRSVNTRIWNDVYFSEDLDPTEKLVFLYFLTNPFLNLAGIYEIPLKSIVSDTGFNKDEILKILSRFEKDKKIYYKLGYVIIANYSRHQKYNRNMLSNVYNSVNLLPKSILSYIKSLDNEPLQDLLKKSLKDYDSLSVSLPNHLLSVDKSSPQVEVEVESEKEVEIKIEGESEKETEVEKFSELRKKINYFELWNNFAEKYDLTIINSLSSSRKNKLAVRNKELLFDFQEILNSIPEQSFLLGNNKNNWKVSFDWLIKNSDNYVKVLEKQYINSKNKPGLNNSNYERGQKKVL